MIPTAVLAWLRAGAPGAKTAAAVAGLLIVAATQAANHNPDGALQSVFAALGLLGVRHAVARQPAPVSVQLPLRVTVQHDSPAPGKGPGQPTVSLHP